MKIAMSVTVRDLARRLAAMSKVIAQPRHKAQARSADPASLVKPRGERTDR